MHVDVETVCRNLEQATTSLMAARSRCEKAKCDDFQQALVSLALKREAQALAAFKLKNQILTSLLNTAAYDRKVAQQAYRKRIAINLATWGLPIIASLILLTMLYRRLGRWQGIKQRVAHARAHGIPRRIRRDLQQGTIIALAVLAALLAWSIIR